jgi:hypothetical protein
MRSYISFQLPEILVGTPAELPYLVSIISEPMKSLLMLYFTLAAEPYSMYIPRDNRRLRLVFLLLRRLDLCLNSLFKAELQVLNLPNNRLTIPQASLAVCSAWPTNP